MQIKEIGLLFLYKIENFVSWDVFLVATAKFL